MLDSRYDFSTAEPARYQEWEKKSYFTPTRDSKKTPFTIIMPPPNANGSLHIGHAMFITLEDLMARFNRMRGKSTLLFPGADHAGILTQVVFERELKKKKLTRYSLGREEFVKQCMEFSQKNKQVMYNQFKKLGASADWSREKFTLDPEISRQVLDTFVSLYNDDLMYRSDRLIDWCPRCMTALSRLEIEYNESKDKLYQIAYPLAEKAKNTGQTRLIIVSTTRPETLLGDTAVAVHPDDSRYKQFIGKMVTLPLMGRTIPIIADKAVDLKFGTGAVKLTPAHDPLDFEIAERHGLEKIQVIDYNNKMTPQAGTYAGLKALEAREAVLKDLKRKGLLVSSFPYTHSVGQCERCKTVIQPQYSMQWFIKVESLVKPALDAVTNKEVQIIPRRFEKTYRQWMENLHDWCISRQLWWGHQIPVWYCGLSGLSLLQQKMNPDITEKNKDNQGCGHITVSADKPKECLVCKNTKLIQDPDTLDTWFSSGQWPYTTLVGNSKYKNQNSKISVEEDSDFNYFYPTTVMETGYDILNIWVSRMIMMGLYRTGKVPFEKVYLHGLVRDEKGQKMSKSKGNVIDPLVIVEKYGADSLRMALIVGATPGNDVSVGEAKIKGYRNFSNKLWNITRFITMNANDGQIDENEWKTVKLNEVDKEFTIKVNKLIKSTTKYLENYKFSLAGEGLYAFVWHELADQYLESVKERIQTGDKTALSILMFTLKTSLKLLHPYIPFVTESIWKEIKLKSEPDLIVVDWPEAIKKK